MILYFVWSLSLFIATSNGFQPNCDSYNQFRSFCFKIRYCGRYECFDSSCGQFPRYSHLVRIKNTKYVPTCAFTHSDALEAIDGRNSAIEVLARGAFKDLTGNLQIDLSFNKIKELHSGIFDNVLAYSLDLSWNQIMYIQEGAFFGLPKLQSLNLSRNALKTFPIHQIPPKLSTIDLSYNFLDEAILTSNRMPSITQINFSRNNLKRIAFSLDNAVKKINLFDNRLKDLDLIELPYCEELSIGKNNFRFIPEPLNFLNITRISIYPNPWKCKNLRQFWTTSQNNFVTLIDEPKSSSVCNEKPKLSKMQLLTTSKVTNTSTICESDSDCQENHICRSHTCWDPCENGVCLNSETCSVINHKIKCSCPKNTKNDVRIYRGECRNVECFTKRHCAFNAFCDEEQNKCIKYDPGMGPMNEPPPPPIPTPSTQGLEWWRYEIPDTKKEISEKVNVN